MLVLSEAHSFLCENFNNKRNVYLYSGRVLADGHVSWACEAFSKLHGQELVSSPALFWYFFCPSLKFALPMDVD